MNSPSFEPCRRALKQAETLSAPPTRERLYKVILQHLEANANGEYDLSSPQLASVVLETWKAGNDLRAEMEMRVGVRDEAVMNAVKEENKEEGGIHAVNEEAVTNTAHSSNPNPNTNLDHRPRPPSLRLRPKPNVGRRSRGTQTEAKRIRIPTTAKATVNCQNTLPNSTRAKANVHRQTLPNFYRFFAGLLLFSFRLSSFSFHASGFRYCNTSGRTSPTSSGLLSSTSCLSLPGSFRPWPLKSQIYFSNSSKHTATLFIYPAPTALSTVSPSRQQPQSRCLVYLAPRIAL